MTVTKTTKSKIANDWQNNFKELSTYSHNKFYKIAGCLILGIELVNLPRSEEYRPYFVIYPLWKKNAKECLDIPLILQEFFNKKNFQFEIPYDNYRHTPYFDEVSIIIKKQYPFLFDGDIAIESIIKVLNEYSQTKRLSIAPESYFQAELLQIKMELTLYKSLSEAQKILEEIKIKNWDQNHFQACGVKLIDWFDFLQKEIDNRDSFLENIQINKSDKKFKDLKKNNLY